MSHSTRVMIKRYACITPQNSQNYHATEVVIRGRFSTWQIQDVMITDDLFAVDKIYESTLYSEIQQDIPMSELRIRLLSNYHQLEGRFCFSVEDVNSTVWITPLYADEHSLMPSTSSLLMAVEDYTMKQEKHEYPPVVPMFFRHFNAEQNVFLFHYRHKMPALYRHF